VAASRCVHTLAAGALAAEQSTALVHVAATWETSVMKMSPFIFLFAYSAFAAAELQLSTTGRWHRRRGGRGDNSPGAIGGEFPTGTAKKPPA